MSSHGAEFSIALIKISKGFFPVCKFIISIIFALFSTGLQVQIGHWHAVQVAKTQPEKLAALEAIFETQKNAPMILFGIPNQEEKKVDLEIAIPGLLSFMIDFNTDYEVKGLNDYKIEDQPPLLISFLATPLRFTPTLSPGIA